MTKANCIRLAQLPLDRASRLVLCRHPPVTNAAHQQDIALIKRGPAVCQFADVVPIDHLPWTTRRLALRVLAAPAALAAQFVDQCPPFRRDIKAVNFLFFACSLVWLN